MVKFILVCVGVFLACATHAQTWQEFVDKGKKAASAGNYAEAQKIYEEALPIVKKQEGDGVAIVLNNLASAYEYQEKYTEAERSYKESLLIMEKIYGKDSAPYATVLDNLSTLYLKQEKYAQVEEMKLLAYQIRKKAYNKPKPSATDIERYALSCNNLGEFYRRQGLHEKTSVFLQEGLDVTVRTKGKENITYAVMSGNLALMYMQNGLYAKAEPLMLESKDIIGRVKGKQHSDYARALNNLGSLYGKQGLLDKAIEIAIEAKDIKAEQEGDKTVSYAYSLNNIASYYMEQKKYKEAEKYLEDAKEIYASKLGLGTPSYATILDNLAIVYEKQGKTEKSIALFRQIKDVMQQSTNQTSYADMLNNYGAMLYRQRQYAEAQQCLTEAHDIYLKRVGEHHDTYGQICKNLANLYEGEKDYDKAEHFFKKAIKSTLLQIEYNIHTLSENEKEVFYSKFTKYFYLFYNFVIEHAHEKPALLGDIFNYQIQLKAILFKTAYQMRERVLTSEDKELRSKYKEWKSTRDRLARLYQSPPDKKEEKQAEIVALETQVNGLEKQLALQSSAFAKATEKITYTWQDAQKKLKQNEAIVEIVHIKFTSHNVHIVGYMALIVKPNSVYPEFVLLEEGEDLENKYIKNYQNSIKFRKQDKHSYEKYWERIAKNIKKSPEINKLYFSPDGVYHSLNVNTLYNPTTQKYVQDEWEIQLLGNVSDLLKTFALPAPTNKKKEAVLVGFPAYNQESDIFLKKNEQRLVLPIDTAQRFLNGEDITELLGTKKEIENLQDILQKDGYKTTTYTQSQASEEMVKKIQSPQLLHIATHGFFLPAVEEDRDKDNIKNRLLRAGLLFAGAKNAFKYGTDGVLTAFEAMDLELEGTDLVVLSACETGLGKIKNGEGVYGLQRAFQQAGAKTILMSLWTVNDTATQELMTLFYQNWILKKQTKRLAFQNAQKELKKKYPEPYYWGAFVMVGE